MADIMSGFWLR